MCLMKKIMTHKPVRVMVKKYDWKCNIINYKDTKKRRGGQLES